MPRSKKVPEQVHEETIKTIKKNTIEEEKQKEKDEKAMRKKQAKEAKHVKEIEAKPVDTMPIIRTKIKPKKTAYTSYISQKYAELKAEGKDSKEIFKELAVIWRSMTEEQKAGFKSS